MPTEPKPIVFEQVDPKTLLAYPKNVKRHPEKQLKVLARGIKEFGFLSPIVLGSGNTILAGHARVKAAIQVGLATVPAVRAEHLTPKQQRAFVLADNQIATLGTVDVDMLREELGGIVRDDKAMAELLGWNDDEIDKLLADPGKAISELLEDGDEESPGAEASSMGYELVFENEAEQTWFYALLKHLKKNRTEETATGRLLGFLGEHWQASGVGAG